MIIWYCGRAIIRDPRKIDPLIYLCIFASLHFKKLIDLLEFESVFVWLLLMDCLPQT